MFQKLEELEEEERLREEAGAYVVPKLELDETMREIKSLALQIRNKRAIMKQESDVLKSSTKPVMPRNTAAKARERSVSRLEAEMTELGVDMTGTENAHFRKTRGRSRSLSQPAAKRMRVDSEGFSRSMSRPPRDEMGVKDVTVSAVAILII